MRVLNKTTRVIYWILLFLSVVVGYVVYIMLPNNCSFNFLVFFSGLPFWFFVTGLFGLLWPKIKPKGETHYISQSIVIGLIFFVLFILHIWFILPLLCPDFKECLLP
jgi:peptidoglycan/LPS O-acetylase OafA/YrhL